MVGYTKEEAIGLINSVTVGCIESVMENESYSDGVKLEFIRDYLKINKERKESEEREYDI